MADPPIASIYRLALLLARQRSTLLNREGLDRLYITFAEALARIASDESTGAISAQRAEALAGEIEDILQLLNRELARNVQRSATETLRDIVAIHTQVNRELIRRYGGGSVIASQFDRVPLRALQAMVSRPGGTAATFQTLINRRIREIIPEVDDFLGAAVARGVSAGRASKDLARLMAAAGGVTQVNDRQAFENAFARIGAGELHRGAGTIDYSRYGLDEDNAAAMRQLLYDARRIQVTETNNAFREANAESMVESPIVIASRWTLSGSHPEEDICDMMAETDAFGYGPGFYPPDSWPISPHPHCRCAAGEVLFRRPADWDKPKPASNPLAIDPSSSEHVGPWAGKWTERQADRYSQQFAAILQEVSHAKRRAA
jgi:hypothetical protein